MYFSIVFVLIKELTSNDEKGIFYMIIQLEKLNKRGKKIKK